jgi:hypothetical protein
MSSNNFFFSGIPLVESPLFDANLEAMGLDPTEREVAIQLNRRGYAVIDFPDPLIDARISRIKERLSPKFGIALDDTEGVQIGGNRRLQDAWTFDEDVRAIATNSAILNLLGKLYGRPAFPFQTLNFPVGTQQEVHSDSVHFSSIPERFMCGVWLAMEDVGPNAGPLCYIPGSHRWPILSNTMIGRHGWQRELTSAQEPYQDAWRAMIAASGIEEETFQPRQGQALIWCANLLHGGSPQFDHRLTRWSQVTHYFFDECVYYTPAFSDEPLGRLALRTITNVTDGQHKANRYLGETVKTPPRKRVGLARKLLSKGKKFMRSLA